MSEQLTRLETFLEKYGSESDPTETLQNELAPLHSLFQTHISNTSTQANLITKYTELTEDSIITEGACQTSRLYQVKTPRQTEHTSKSEPRTTDTSITQKTFENNSQTVDSATSPLQNQTHSIQL